MSYLTGGCLMTFLAGLSYADQLRVFYVLGVVFVLLVCVGMGEDSYGTGS